MRGKVCLITGATNGIGLETARCLAEKNATVVLVGRNPEKTQRVVDELRQSTGSPNLDFLLADLSLMSEVRKLASDFQSRYDRLDVLINNAGGVFGRREVTSEGLELTFALNHLSYFLLTHLLLDTLKASAPARIVNLASEAHRNTQLDFDNLQGEKGYMGFRNYGRSKLMNIMFTIALARRGNCAEVTVNAVHPGFINSGFAKNNNILWKTMMFLARPLTKSVETGALTPTYLAASSEVSHITGKYFSDSRPIKPSDAALDIEAQEKLWDISVELTGVGAREPVMV